MSTNNESKSTIAITIRTRVERPRPTDTGVNGGIDYDAEVIVTDEAGIEHRWDGELTYAPDHTGELVPYGSSVDYWMDGGMLACIKEPWIAAHQKLVDAITKSLAGGEGVEDLEVAL